MAGEKTEKATPKRKQDERKKGNIFLSQEIVAIASMLSAFVCFRALSPLFYTSIESSLTKYLAMGATQTQISATDITMLWIDGCITFVMATIPLLLLGVLTNIVITMAQTKMLFSSKAFEFKADRLSPLKGLKKMFSMRSTIELLKAILKISVLLYIIYSIMKDELLILPRLMEMSPLQATIYTADIIWRIALQAGLIFIFVAAGDYLYQWWEYEKNLRMSKQEIKDEYKQLEGDPQVKGRMRSMQQQKSRRRMMQSVPSADVVIRNPTHYAVAIGYDQEKNRAPIILAKGADSVALRIVAIAEENGVYVTENRPLARALFETVDMDTEIPSEHYQAIAEILAFVYNLKKLSTKS